MTTAVKAQQRHSSNVAVYPLINKVYEAVTQTKNDLYKKFPRKESQMIISRKCDELLSYGINAIINRRIGRKVCCSRQGCSLGY
jgi:hypothetical protein